VKVHKDWHKSAKGTLVHDARVAWKPSPSHTTRAGRRVLRDHVDIGRGQDWKSFRTTRRSEAQERAEAFIRAQFENDAPSQAQPLTLGELWTQYQQEAPGYRQNTKRTQDDKHAAARRLLAFFSVLSKSSC